VDPDEQNRAHVLELLTGNLPVTLWSGLQDRARSLYMDTFSEARSDPQINNSQRLHWLWQRRHFRMENLLQDEATQHGVPANSELIERNRCYFTLAQQGPVRMTQSYVRAAGDLPKPANFRKQLAKLNAFQNKPRLILFEDERPFTMPPKITGIILHSPTGTTFREEHQALGAIGFYVPYNDFSGWAVKLTFADIVASYAAPVEQVDNVTPKLRPIRKTGEEE
jgi:hypothetical protein